MSLIHKPFQDPATKHIPAVLFDAVSMRYGDDVPVINDVSFALAAGSFTYITGMSGAGKSTLLKLAYFGLRPSAGRVEVFGQDYSKLPRESLPLLRRKLGLVFQDFRLLNHLTCLQNVALPLHVTGAHSAKVDKEARELLDWVGLSHRLHALPASLSGGEKQRVAIARAVIMRPRLLIADEPTGNIDDTMATRLLYLFEELNKLGTTILLATHSEALVAQFPHPRLVLHQGQLGRLAA